MKNYSSIKDIKFILLIIVVIYILILANKSKKTQNKINVDPDEIYNEQEYITENDLKDSEPKVQLVSKETIEQKVKKAKINIFKGVKISNENRIFIEGLIKVALEEQERFGIPASIKIAQAILESGWGKDNLAKTHNNYFGIKHKRHYSEIEKKLVGAPVLVTTHEYNKLRQKYYKKDNFISYETRWCSIRHHSLFLKERIDNGQNNAYKKLRNLSVYDYKAWARNLQNTGYATSPNYSKTLIKIIETYNLNKITYLATK
jgi:flagellum-specific peptidoglycan hydrolase FlgJ